MKSREWLFGVFSSLVAVPGVAGQADLTPELTQAHRLKELPTLIRLKERENEITVKSDGENLFYTVDSPNGGRLENVRLEEIQAKNPELYERLKVTIAEPTIDASNRYDQKSESKL